MIYIDSDISEKEIYHKIIDFFFQYHNNSNKDLDFLKDLSIIEVFNFLRSSNSSFTPQQKSKIMQNAIIIFLALFNDDPLDHFHSMGKELKTLSIKEKNLIFSSISKTIKN